MCSLFGRLCLVFFFYTASSSSEIYTLSLHDALPILFAPAQNLPRAGVLLAIPALVASGLLPAAEKIYESLRPSFYGDRKSTRLNSSHQIISYAVFCLKKKIQTLILCFLSKSAPVPLP